jgi:hypothetical protein
MVAKVCKVIHNKIMREKLILNDVTTSRTAIGVIWYEAWLQVDGVVVSYAKIWDKPSYNGKLCVCTIETRDGHRQQGHSKTLLSLVESRLGKTVCTNADFTPEGFLALGNRPVLDGYEPATGPRSDSMNFVRDWETMEGPF